MNKDKKIIRDILSGVFVAATTDSACIVDTVLQVSSTEPALISVTVNKNNYTNEMIKKNQKFAIAILSKEVDGNIIKTFGFNSSRDIDKYENFDYIEVEGIKILKNSIGYMVCQVIDTVDTKTHDIFIGKIIASERFNNEEPLSYLYYQEHKDDYLKVKTSEGKTAWICTVCGYIYYGDELPNDFKCPVCGVGASSFERKN